MNYRSLALGFGSVLTFTTLGLITGCGDDTTTDTTVDSGAGPDGGGDTTEPTESSSGDTSDSGSGETTSEAGSSAMVTGDVAHVVPEGTDYEPGKGEGPAFATIYEALAAIANTPDWDGTIVLHEGRHELPTDVVIPPNAYLKILKGTTIASGGGISIHAQRDVTAEGTEDAPILFTWLEDGTPWGSLTNFEPTSQKNVFEYVTFEHGNESDFNGIGMRGALSLNKASAHISHCRFENNTGDDGLNIKASNSLIEYSTFKDNISDGFDSDGVAAPEVRFCTFDGNGNDNLDLGEGTEIHVHDNLILHAGDKGISNGDGCTPVIEHNVIANGALGIGIKDDANPIVRNNTLYNNQFGIRIYHHVDGFAGGQGTVTNNIIWGSAEGDLLFETGTTVLAYNCFSSLLDADGNDVVDNDGNVIADMDGILTKGAGCDDPMFGDPDNLDFHLKSEAGRYDAASSEWVMDDVTSPLIDKGDPATDIGDEPAPNGGRVNLGFEGGGSEASKSAGGSAENDAGVDSGIKPSADGGTPTDTTGSTTSSGDAGSTDAGGAVSTPDAGDASADAG
ncbi:MAG TPA: right-handed parallel beta-helix repeat-containing protein [Polyangiaceae bacterium]|jgi:parallel beta-helix repeat protein|nr:right-handed parallel beta-helix repeat-containing protein [Polyangiaceae bacterium]